MTDLWTTATRDETTERYESALRSTMGALTSITAGVLDAESEDGFDTRLAMVGDKIDAIITSATYSDPVLFARVQDEVTARLRSTFAKKLAWVGVKTARSVEAGSEADIDAWFDSNVLAEYVDLLEPLKKHMVYGPDYKRGVREKIGDAMFALRQGYAGDKAYHESVLHALVGTTLNGEAWYWDANANAYTQRLFGSKKTAYTTGDQATCRNCGLDIEYWDTDGVWLDRGSNTSCPAAGKLVDQKAADNGETDGIRYPSELNHEPYKTASKTAAACPGCDKDMGDTEKANQEHVRSCPFGGKTPDNEKSEKKDDPELDKLLSEAAITIADGEVFSAPVTAKLYLTALRHEGMVHWALNDETGEEEVAEGSEKSVRDALEEARNTIDTILQDAEQSTSPAPDAAPDTNTDAPVDPTQVPDDNAQETDAPSTEDPADPDAAVPPQEAPATNDGPVKETVNPDDPGAAPVPTDDDAPDAPDVDPVGPDALDPDAPTDVPGDDPADPGMDDATDDADPSDDTPPELNSDDADPDAIVDSANEESEGDVTGIDPKSMGVGDRVNMTYTLTDGTTGDVDVTFVREDNDIYFFDGPNGEFGLGERDDDATGGTIWVDSEGQNFAFADGDALEEISGEEVPGEADVQDVDLEAAVGAPATAEADTEAPNKEEASEAPPAEGDAPKGDEKESSEDDSDDDDDDFKKKFASILTAMGNENPDASVKQLSTLARRAAKLSMTLGRFDG